MSSLVLLDRLYLERRERRILEGERESRAWMAGPMTGMQAQRTPRLLSTTTQMPASTVVPDRAVSL